MSTDDVIKLIKDLDKKSSCGITDIPVGVIKHSAITLSKPICHLLNYCLTNNCLPNEWKFAIVTPLYKQKGELSDFNNYRGISVLSPFSKLFERILQRQILNYFDVNKLFNNSQHGFRAGFSCETALHELISKWRNNMNKGLLNLAFLTISRKHLIMSTLIFF